MNDSDPSKPKRRWHPFRVRTLLVAVVALSVGFGWLAVRLQRVKNERVTVAEIQRAAAQIETLGGQVSVARMHVRKGRWLDGLLGHPGYISWVCAVHVDRVSTFSDADMVHLERLVEANSLLPDNFQRLTLKYTSVTDAGLEHVKGLTSLTNLLLDGAQVTDAGLKHVRELTNLRELGLARTQVTGPGLEHLNELPGLHVLDLSFTPVDDAGLEHLEGLTNLTHLRLSCSRVTDAGLEHLKGLTELETLTLDNTQVTDEGVRELQQALPNCKIEHLSTPFRR